MKKIATIILTIIFFCMNITPTLSFATDIEFVDEYAYDDFEISQDDDFELIDGYSISDETEDDLLLAAVSYKSVSVTPGENIMIFNNNSRSIGIKTDGACQMVVYDSNGDIKSVKEREKGNGSISISKGGSALISNSGSSTLTVKGDERYFNNYKMGYGNVYIDYRLGAGESIKLVNNSKMSGNVKITSLPETYAFIKYKTPEKLLSGGKWKKSKSLSVSKGQTLIITNESNSSDMILHFSTAVLDKSSSFPAYVEKKLPIGSKCVVSNNSSQSLKLYAKNFANKKFAKTVKAHSSKTLQAESFGVYVYVPFGFMSVE